MFIQLKLPAASASIAMLLLAIGSATAHCAHAGFTSAVAIPPGTFTMGDDNGPQDERPAHRVSVPAFQIDRFPVTNAQFAEFLNAIGPRNKEGERLYDDNDADARIHQRGSVWAADDGYGNHPVVEVPWAAAADYCAWRNQRLPTEAEWEKAARGSDARKYPWGNTPPDKERAQFAAPYNETKPVDAFAKGSSPYGVVDMAGNAWEWVSSAYRPYPYSATDGREDLRPGPVRVTRGGGHDSPPAEITTTQRGRNLSRNPRSGHHNIGFRCAK